MDKLKENTEEELMLKKTYAVFGNPILHSKSPQLYNSLFRFHKEDGFYTRVLTWSGRMVCDIIRSYDLAGANITTPFKEDVVEHLDSLSPDAKKLSAVNTIINRQGKLSGFNTDTLGVTGSLIEAGVNPDGIRCLVIGAGGAGKAAAMGLVKAGADVVIANRSPEKALSFSKIAGCGFMSLDKAVKNISSFRVVVMTLPPGIIPFDKEIVSKDVVFVDANYRSPSGSDMEKNLPGNTIRGDRWLLHQAVESYKIYTNREADLDVMDKSLNDELEYDKIKISILTGREQLLKEDYRVDMIVDGRGMDKDRINNIIDEEKSRAFGSKG